MAITNNGRFHSTRNKKKRKNHLLDTSFFCFLSKRRKMNENRKTWQMRRCISVDAQRKRTPLAFCVLDTDETDSNKTQKKMCYARLRAYFASPARRCKVASLDPSAEKRSFFSGTSSPFQTERVSPFPPPLRRACRPRRLRSLALLLRLVAAAQRLGEVVPQRVLLLAVLQRLDRAQPVDDVLRLAEVDLVQRGADLVLHALFRAPHCGPLAHLDHLADVGDVRHGLADGAVLLHLPGEAAPQVHGPRAGLLGLEPQHGRGGQLVVRTPPLGETGRPAHLHFHDVDGVPAAHDLPGAVPALLDEHDARKAVVQVPQVDRGHSTLEVHLPVLVEGLVGIHLQLAQTLRRERPVLQRRVVAVTPGGPE
ncbi:unnamed protein product [Ixodes persulcatus]